MDFQAGYISAKAIFDIAKGINSLNTEADRNLAIIHIQREAIEAQQGYAAVLRRIDELEQEIMELKDWSAEKERYHLKAIAPRAFAYAMKPEIESADDPHWLCQPCFDSGHKAALQFGSITNPGGPSGLMAVWACGKCNSSVLVGRSQTPSIVPVADPPPPPPPPDYDRFAELRE